MSSLNRMMWIHVTRSHSVRNHLTANHIAPGAARGALNHTTPSRLRATTAASS